MANNYLEFSEAIDSLTKEEVLWLQEQLADITVGDWTGPRFLLDNKENDGYAEFEAELEGPGATNQPLIKAEDLTGNDGDYLLWLHTSESGNVGQVGLLVQAYLKKFHPDRYWTLTYATFCSKPRIGEFGGGAIFVTAEGIDWFNAYDAVDAKIKEWLEAHPGGSEITSGC